ALDDPMWVVRRGVAVRRARGWEQKRTGGGGFFWWRGGEFFRGGGGGGAPPAAKPRKGMRAITVSPGLADSARLDDVPEPPPADGAVLVRSLALGVCGTDREILSGAYGSAPPGEPRLVLGHESLGEVEDAPEDCGLAAGDLVVGIVRRPDPVPCVACAAGEWDMCRNGRYTERGIKERNGYGAERFRLEPDFAIKVDPTLGVLGVLLEPASILAKAWDHTERIGHRARAWQPKCLLVTGAGPIGLLAAARRPCALVQPQPRRPEGGPIAPPRRQLSQRYGDADPASARYRDGMHRLVGRHSRLSRRHRRGGHRLPDRGERARPHGRPRHRPRQPHDGAGKRHRVRRGERQSPPLRDGGGRAPPRRPPPACPPAHPP